MIPVIKLLKLVEVGSYTAAITPDLPGNGLCLSGKLVTAQLLARARSDQISTACVPFLKILCWCINQYTW
jgi:hypothetical protein